MDDPRALPSPFCDLLAQRGTRVISIGIATVSVYKRLVEQDVRHQQPSTFFRGIGSILGYRPPPGSLVGKANQNNYKFSPADTAEIIEWIEEHLLVNWVEAKPALATMEKSLIPAHAPIMNTTHNPDPVAELAALRLECRTIARTAS
jgi:hypothetical protein